MKPSLAKLEARVAALAAQRLRPIIVWCDAAGEIPEIVANAIASGAISPADRDRCIFVRWLERGEQTGYVPVRTGVPR